MQPAIGSLSEKKLLLIIYESIRTVGTSAVWIVHFFCIVHLIVFFSEMLKAFNYFFWPINHICPIACWDDGEFHFELFAHRRTQTPFEIVHIAQQWRRRSGPSSHHRHHQPDVLQPQPLSLKKPKPNDCEAGSRRSPQLLSAHTQPILGKFHYVTHFQYAHDEGRKKNKKRGLSKEEGKVAFLRKIHRAWFQCRM